MNKDLLTVGELAKSMGVTVRTLQYYDNKGLLKASVRSGGGRRLYTKKYSKTPPDIITLIYRCIT